MRRPFYALGTRCACVQMKATCTLLLSSMHLILQPAITTDVGELVFFRRAVNRNLAGSVEGYGVGRRRWVIRVGERRVECRGRVV